MNNCLKRIFFLIFISAIIFSFILMTVKILAYRGAIKNDSIWSRDKKCELVTYIPDYRPYGGIGRVLRLFSNQSFFIVYDQNGKKIKNSAWYFWQSQFSDLVAPEWHGQNATYPTSDGWDGWHIPECH
ncbi:hypothetical protein [Enterobacter ludwigii]|jgi:hypothetical protein|uniref:hypothetical protein n=1 Tax=Enterobacter ludwigii TaxID=299767 RepID=UPI0008FF8567|nr:hypothetical protein [Enterobacter ludwigii]